MIRRCELDRALTAVRKSGVATRVERLVNPLRTGRPRQLKVDAFLAAIILTAEKKALTLTNVHATLTKELSLSARIALGTEYRPAPTCEHRSLSIRQVRYLLEAIERRLAYTEGRAPDLEPEDRELRRAALQHVMDGVLAASPPSSLPSPTDFALDETAIESWARVKRHAVLPAAGMTDTTPCNEEEPETLGDTWFSFDPDGRPGYRTKTYDNKSSRCFGYGAYAMVGMPAIGAPEKSMPLLTYAFTLRPLATDVAEPGLSLVDGLIEHGYNVSVLANDRASSYLLAPRWATELRSATSSRSSTFIPQTAVSVTSRASRWSTACRTARPCRSSTS
ncbi:MAG: hypothetical protein ACP5PM_05625 [Acidimicrobiales bacterium]